MKKASKLFAAFAAVALMSACSSDEPATGGEDPGVADGQKAYLAVTINSTGDMGKMGKMGRSTDYDVPTYEDGDDTEHAVNSASFFFFDEQGNYVLKASVLNPAFGEDNPADENIEYISTKNILVLEDLKGKNYPTYMLTVLNMDNFTAEATLAATTQKLSDYADNFTDTKKNFVMSTTAYFGSDANHDNTYYNVTKLIDANFKLTADEAQNTSPVDVYVERLAAKVQVGVTATAAKTLQDGTVLYELRQTIAGDGNDLGTPGDGLANTRVYLKVLGWGLNATAPQAYVGKQLKSEWNTTVPFANWQNAAYFRSFWAYSYPYFQGANPTLNYTNVPALTAKANGTDAQYCYENTNSATNIFRTNTAGQNLVIPSKVTHVVLRTQICDENGVAKNVIEFRGVPYEEDTFRAYVLSSLKNSVDGLNYYYKTGETEDATSYTQVDVNDIKFVGTGELGKVDIKLTDATKALYQKGDDGKFSSITDGATALQARLTAFQGENRLYQYNKGTNLYYIPIEQAALAANKEKEGYYGVVRNHWYKLSISSFSKLGHASYDPDNATETIKPEQPEDPLYYVGAKINILSWRIINQSVDL